MLWELSPAAQPNVCPLSAACQGGYTREGASYAFPNVLHMEQVYPYASRSPHNRLSGSTHHPAAPRQGPAALKSSIADASFKCARIRK